MHFYHIVKAYTLPISSVEINYIKLCGAIIALLISFVNYFFVKIYRNIKIQPKVPDVGLSACCSDNVFASLD